MVSWAHPSALLVFQFVVICECHDTQTVVYMCEDLLQEHYYSLYFLGLSKGNLL